MSELQILIPALIGLSVATTGWWYSRRIGVQQAEKSLMQALREQISLMESARLTQERRTAMQIEDLEKRLAICEQRWRTWTQRVGE